MKNVMVVDRAEWDALHAAKWNNIRPIQLLLIVEHNGSILIEKCAFDQTLKGQVLTDKSAEYIKGKFKSMGLLVDI